jgi:hypothetical protein
MNPGATLPGGDFEYGDEAVPAPDAQALQAVTATPPFQLVQQRPTPVELRSG